MMLIRIAVFSLLIYEERLSCQAVSNDHPHFAPAARTVAQHESWKEAALWPALVAIPVYFT